MSKIVNFNKLTVENFLSIGNKPVEVNFRSGIHVITGANRDQSDRRNGIGKSTILDSLSFVLFGSTLRELKKEFVINNITKKT
jgi:DNA repair exonuclease SbcCD ATPase subunit